MNKLKDYCGVLISLAAVIGLVLGAMNYFAKASDVAVGQANLQQRVDLVELRLEQKIVNDQAYDTQKQVWTLEERNKDYGSDCSKWPDARDREQYRRLKNDLDELQKQKDNLKKK
jgi:uncharacterized protein YlxW (UPF0749 family)